MTDTDTHSDTDVQTLVGPQLRALADVLAAQPPAVADAPSLCEGWAVKHVVAHMTMAARYDTAEFMELLGAAGYDFETLSQQVAHRDGCRPFASLLDDLRSDTMAAWEPPGGGAVGALTHAVIHALDCTGALDLPRSTDDAATRLVLDTLTEGVAGHFGVDLTGRALAATDLAWNYGSGMPVRAPAGDLVLALSGRARSSLDL